MRSYLLMSFFGLVLIVSVGATLSPRTDQVNIQKQQHIPLENVWHLQYILQQDSTAMITEGQDGSLFPYDPRRLLDGTDLAKFCVMMERDYNVSECCMRDVLTLVEDLMAGDLYALQVIDSIGKPGSGLFYGNIKWMGSFEECKNSVKVVEGNITFQGEYCLVGITTSVIPALDVGVCVPNSCSNNDTVALVNAVLAVLGPAAEKSTAVTALCATDKDLTTGAIVAIAIMSFLGGLGILGTMYDVVLWYMKHNRPLRQPSTQAHLVNSPGLGGVVEHTGASLIDNEILNEEPEIQSEASATKPLEKGTSQQPEPGMFVKFLLAFSWWTNGAKLLSTKQSDGTLTCVHGIRFLSMAWVILGHSVSFMTLFTDNIVLAASVLTKRFTFQAVENATFSVDSFFFLSGLLVTFLTIKHLRNNNGRLNWAMFYFHRFWRLTPTYMLVLMFFTTLTLYLPHGPLQRGFDNSPGIIACYKYWWANLLYVNNFVPGDIAGQCMGWAWFLANDMQFHVVSPVILYLLYRWKRAGLGLIGLLCVANFVVTGVLSHKWKIVPGPNTLMNATNKEKEEYTNHTNYIYQRFYHRMASYLVGMATGFLLVDFDCKAKLHQLLTLAGWTIATAINMSVLYGLYHYYHNNTTINLELGAFYTAVSRCAWCVGLGWLTFACVTGNGGPVNAILSWPVFIPLGRLTYCAYLVHPIVIFVYLLSMKTPFHYTDDDLVYIYLGNMVLSYTVAFVVSLAIEAPMLRLEKLLFKREKTGPNLQNPSPKHPSDKNQV